MGLFRKKCQIHDREVLEAKMLYDILRELEREGYPVIVNRHVLGLDKSGVKVVSPDMLDVEYADKWDRVHNSFATNNVCMRCNRVRPGVRELKDKWRSIICTASHDVKNSIKAKVERQARAKRLWKESKYGTSK